MNHVQLLVKGSAPRALFAKLHVVPESQAHAFLGLLSYST